MSNSSLRGHAQASAVIPASQARLYGVLADYHLSHPQILPRDYFRKLEVEEGGVGEGTRTRLEMHVLGATKTFRHVVSEPEPGRVLVETELNGENQTRFTVDPVGDGTSRLTIETEFSTSGGVLGRVERFLTERMLRSIYEEQLSLITQFVATGR